MHLHHKQKLFADKIIDETGLLCSKKLKMKKARKYTRNEYLAWKK